MNSFYEECVVFSRQTGNVKLYLLFGLMIVAAILLFTAEYWSDSQSQVYTQTESISQDAEQTAPLSENDVAELLQKKTSVDATTETLTKESASEKLQKSDVPEEPKLTEDQANTLLKKR